MIKSSSKMNSFDVNTSSFGIFSRHEMLTSNVQRQQSQPQGGNTMWCAMISIKLAGHMQIREVCSSWISAAVRASPAGLWTPSRRVPSTCNRRISTTATWSKAVRIRLRPTAARIWLVQCAAVAAAEINSFVACILPLHESKITTRDCNDDLSTYLVIKK